MQEKEYIKIPLSASNKQQEDIKVANEILSLLNDKAHQIDFILQLVCCELVKTDEQLTNKLHMALANTTTNLLKNKQELIILASNTIPFAYNKKLAKLHPEAKISYLLDICSVAFPNAKLEGFSDMSKAIYMDTLNCLKQVIIDKQITTYNQLKSFYSHKMHSKLEYMLLFAMYNNLLEV